MSGDNGQAKPVIIKAAKVSRDDMAKLAAMSGSSKVPVIGGDPRPEPVPKFAYKIDGDGKIHILLPPERKGLEPKVYVLQNLISENAKLKRKIHKLTKKEKNDAGKQE